MQAAAVEEALSVEGAPARYTILLRIHICSVMEGNGGRREVQRDTEGEDEERERVYVTHAVSLLLLLSLYLYLSLSRSLLRFS